MDESKLTERELISDVAGFVHDPLGYVLYAFPWREGELEKHDGPRDWQAAFLQRMGAKLNAAADPERTIQEAIQEAIASGHGVGKALDVDTIIPTPNGDRRFGDLKPGDLVYGSNGEPTIILATRNQGLRPTYRVRFDDGTEVLADEAHDWAVSNRQHRRTHMPGWLLCSTKQILDLGVKRPNGASEARQWQIPTVTPLMRGDIDRRAYPLGVWLGDGSCRGGRYSKPDIEVEERIRFHGWETQRAKSRDAVQVYDFVHEIRGFNLLGLKSPERYVPLECFQWNAPSRAELLRGLLDTDGECAGHGVVVFSSTSRALAEGVARLARSLGGKASPTRVKAAYFNGKRHRDCFRVTVSMPDGFQPFYIKRKLKRVLGKRESRYLTKWIDSIEPVGLRETMCIQVAAEDALFLANDYIVTHNSALVAWIILWALSTFEDTRGIVTANTENQLKTKTWAELAKWHRLAINRHWFVFTATALYSAQPDHEKTWRIDMVVWSENNTEAFAGLHNQGKRVILIFDEASAIPDKIWEVSEGALTDEDTEIIWCVFGNPTRNTGRFRQCFGNLRHRWGNTQLDSREVEGTNKNQIDKWIQDYGEDSDFVRIRVRGVFPRASSMQFISSELVAEAQRREARCNLGDPLIMTLDVARGGDDNCVFRFRRGLDAKSIAPIKIPGSEVRDSMLLVSKAVALIEERKPDAFFFDGTGVGGPVGDRIKQLGYTVMEVQFGAASPDPRYANFRAYMWARGKQWLQDGGAIDNDNTLETDLTSVEFGHDKKDRLLLESKESMKARGLASPDDGDALMMTFAFPVAPTDGPGLPGVSARVDSDWDPYRNA